MHSAPPRESNTPEIDTAIAALDHYAKHPAQFLVRCAVMVIDAMPRPSTGEIVQYMKRRALEHYERAKRLGDVADAQQSIRLAKLCEAAAETLERRTAAP